MPTTVSNFIATTISTTGTTLTYDITNYSSNVYMFQYLGTTAPSILDDAGLIKATINVNGSTQSTTITSLTKNNTYTFAFYNGQTTGSSSQIGTPVTIKTFESCTALTNTANTQTSTTINYTFSNTLSSSCTAYLYRFVSGISTITAPDTLDNTGSYINSAIVTGSGSPSIPKVISGTISDTSLSSNNYYVYAFYDGQSLGTSKILTNTSATNTTSNFISYATISSLSASVGNTTSTINYTINNNLSTSTTTTYLYRFSGSSAPTLDPTKNGSAIGSAITTTSLGTSSTPINDTSLSINTQYTYAFYNGNTSSATILNNTSMVTQSVTVNTSNLTNTDLSLISFSPNTTPSININYTIVNNPSPATTIYLYRSTSSLSTTLNTSSSTQITSVNISANSTSTNISYTDSSSILLNTNYTYAFYDGQTNGSSKILTSDGSISTTLTVSTIVTTVAFTTTTNILNISATTNYTLTNTGGTPTAYLYLIQGASLTTLLPSSNVTYIGSSSDSLTTLNLSSLTKNTQYTYAFYSGQTAGTSVILTNTSGVNQSVSFYTTNLLNTSLTATVTPNTISTISYTLTNTNTGSVNARAY